MKPKKKIPTNDVNDIQNVKIIISEHLALFEKTLERIQKDSDKIKQLESDVGFLHLWFEIASYFAGIFGVSYLIYRIFHP